MIIWSGWGLIVLGIVVAIFLVMNSIFGSILGLNTFADSKWMDSISLLISAVLCWYTGKHINKPSGRIFVDKVTGEEFREGGGRHRLFFIKVEYWAIILVLVGIAIFFE